LPARRPVIRPRPEPRVATEPSEDASSVEVTSVAVPGPRTGDEPGRRVETRRPAGGARHRRRLEHRRRVREQLLILLVFLIALAVTVILLASQWLLNASVTATIGTTGAATGLPFPDLAFT
jgi:hypothetical protein